MRFPFRKLVRYCVPMPAYGVKALRQSMRRSVGSTVAVALSQLAIHKSASRGEQRLVLQRHEPPRSAKPSHQSGYPQVPEVGGEVGEEQQRR